MPSPKAELLSIKNSSWKWMGYAATRCILKVATLLPIRIATHDAHAAMGLGDAVFAWRVPWNQSRNGMALCGCSRTAKKERQSRVGITASHRHGPCSRHRGGDPGSGAGWSGDAGAHLENRCGDDSGWLRRIPHREW